jgi:hypothetical protein
MELGRQGDDVLSKRISRITLLFEVAMLRQSGMRVRRTSVGCSSSAQRRKGRCDCPGYFFAYQSALTGV